MARFRLEPQHRRRRATPVELAVAAVFLIVLALRSFDGGGSHERELEAAVRADDVAALDAVIEAGGDPFWTDVAGGTLLHTAAYWGCDAVASYLIARGLPVDVTDHSGQTPLHAAARGGRASTAQWLLRAGADSSRLTTAEMITCDGHRIPPGSTAMDIARTARDASMIDVLAMASR